LSLLTLCRNKLTQPCDTRKVPMVSNPLSLSILVTSVSRRFNRIIFGIRRVIVQSAFPLRGV